MAFLKMGLYMQKKFESTRVSSVCVIASFFHYYDRCFPSDSFYSENKIVSADVLKHCNIYLIQFYPLICMRLL